MLIKKNVLAVVLGLASLVASSVGAQQFQFPQGGFGSQFGGGPSGAQVTLDAQFAAPADGQPALLFVTANIAEGYHIYAVDQANLPDNGGGPQPTSIEITGPATVRQLGPFQSLQPPHSHIDQIIWQGLELREHADQVTWYAPVELSAGVDPATLLITGKVITQACDDHGCIPLELAFDARVGEGFAIPESSSQYNSTGTATGQTVTGQSTSSLSLLAVVCYGLIGGLILNLMPCVLPVIGLKILGFAEQGGQSRARILGLNLSYSAGLLSVFLILATLAAAAKLGLGSESYGWGELYTLTWFKVAMTALVFAMALSFLGVWELPIPGFATSSQATQLASQEGALGAFVMGVFTTILATPCSGPFLGPVFGYTITQPPSIIYLIFFSVGLGMAFPYLLIGAVPSLVRWLPKPGTWMNTFKHLLGFVLLATVIYLFSTIHHDYFIATLSLLFGIWFACWWIGQTPFTAGPQTRRRAWFGGTIAATLIGVMAFQWLTPGDSVLQWQEFTPTSLATARAEGKTVLVDFTADWCPTCKTNLKFAINRKEVKQHVESNGVVTMVADWTDKNETIKQALLDLGSQSIPLLVIYPADASLDPIVLPDLLTKAKVLEALKAAGPSIGSARTEKGELANADAASSSNNLQRAAAFR